MSLGWNTESALLPKKAKPITVGDKSLFALKAIVYEKEQQQQQQLQLKHEGLSSSSYRNQRGNNVPNKKKDVFERSNKGIGSRSAKEDPLKIAKSDRIYAALKAKSELYDQLQSNSSLSKAGSSAFLVDFASKSSDEVTSSSSSSHAHKGDILQQYGNNNNYDDNNDNDDDTNYSDVEDEFGRSRRVHRKSQEYVSITLERERKRRRKMYSGGGPGDHYRGDDKDDYNESRHNEYEQGRIGREKTESPQSSWAWSTGHAHKNDYYRDREDEIEAYNADAKAKLLLQNRVESEISQAARVKSHWEKTISGKAKGYLEEIHLETMDMKKMAAAKIGNDIKSISSNESTQEVDHVKDGSKTSAKEDRIAMIKRMREKKKSQQSIPSEK